MDPLPSCTVAASLLGFSSEHPFVYLGRILQETRLKVQESTDGEVLLGLTMTRVGGSGGLLLFGSGFVDGGGQPAPSPHMDNLVSVGVDSLCDALRQVDAARRASPAPPSPLPPPSHPMPSTGGRAVDETGDTPLSGLDDAPPSDGNPSELLAASVLGSEEETLGVGRTAPIPPIGGSLATGTGASDVAGAHLSLSVHADGSSVLQGRAEGAAAGRGDGGSSFAVDGAAQQRAAVEGAAGPPAFVPVSGGAGGVEGAVARGALVGGASPAPDTSGSELAVALQPYNLPTDFKLPGLISTPNRISLPSGRGRTRVFPPTPQGRTVTVPDALAYETIKELMPRPGDKSLRFPLLAFIGLYKFVVDTLVKRTILDSKKREEVDHSYLQLTPEATRGALVKFMNYKGQRVETLSPVFANQADTKVNPAMAVILLMKHDRDPFFLWLMGMFVRGARAPCDAIFGASVAPATVGARRRGRKRDRNDIEGGNAVGVLTRVGDTGIGGGGGADAGRGAAALAGVSAAASAVGLFDMVALLRVQHLLCDGRVVADAELHPEWEMFHGSETPFGVVGGFLRSVAESCGDVTYPFGQDSSLCLERGNPSDNPVALGAIDVAYRMAWPVGCIGYVLIVHGGDGGEAISRGKGERRVGDSGSMATHVPQSHSHAAFPCLPAQSSALMSA